MWKDLASTQKDPRIIEIMLLGSGISHLKTVGSGYREVEYYCNLSTFIDIWIFGYSAKDASVKELPINFIRNKWLRSIWGPFFLGQYVHNNTLIRTKQLWGCWTGWIFKIVYRKKLIIRCGYIWSRSFMYRKKQSNQFFYWIIRRIEDLLIGMGDAFVFTTDEVARHYSKRIGNKRYRIIPNGYNTSIFKPIDNEILFDYVYLGRLIPLKGIVRLLTIIDSSQKLLIIGSGEYSEALRYRRNITHLSFVPNHELPHHLTKARCFISLSFTEGNPKGTFEAILCGLYPVLSDISAHRGIINELGYGTIVEDSAIALPDSNKFRIDDGKLESFRKKYDEREIIHSELSFCNELLCRSLK